MPKEKPLGQDEVLAVLREQAQLAPLMPWRMNQWSKKFLLSRFLPYQMHNRQEAPISRRIS
eukprot:Seg734.11 transcript_id=Seg734.11/GoldUCD/mRNA.D3Y31 product="hypothetical protein" pseudo=true protein_id=Seg734.11/GoldUCD/D3Y31